ncbi:MAG: hypothetical protein WCB02_34570 [Bradyrhizobium sp.]
MVDGPPGVELHTVVDELPSGDTAGMVPVALPTIGVGMVPKGVADVIAVADIGAVDGAGTDDIVGAVETAGVVPMVAPVADMGVTGTTGVPGAI